jgi:uncharacterized protein YecE (DUF72 family)
VATGKPGRLRIGTSGFQYAHWKRVLYPPDLPRKEWFARYATMFDTVEINNTFYRLPEASTFVEWRKQAPTGFRYALKFSRYGSHLKRLREPGGTVGLFLERAGELKSFLGPILVQLPPRWRCDPGRLRDFVDALPPRRRWVVEFRDADWLREEIFALLERRNIALCVHDRIPDHPRRPTASWMYLRFHGMRTGGRYTRSFLRAEAARVRRELEAGMDVYVYFNNDTRGHAVRNALQLKELTSAVDRQG